MAAAPHDRRQSIDHARKEADRCADLAKKTGSHEAKAVYLAIRESWTRIANSLESTETTGVPSRMKVDPQQSRSQLPTTLGDAGTKMPNDRTMTPSVAEALAQAKWCVDQAAKEVSSQRDTYLRLRDRWIQVANEMQMLDRAERALSLSVDARRHRKIPCSET
jgi:hypothetical protein